MNMIISMILVNKIKMENETELKKTELF